MFSERWPVVLVYVGFACLCSFIKTKRRGLLARAVGFERF